jgi:glutathione synthase/RimK-type ligase-like ATP-grasp enzyme
MNYLLYNKGSYITARSLATKLGLKATSNPAKIKQADKSPIIRYGNSDGEFRKDTILNSSEVIHICSNSLHFCKWAKQNGFISPIYTKFNPDNIPEYPFLLRMLYHKRGSDIILIKSKADLNKLSRQVLLNRWYVPFIETTFELRVHVVCGEIARIFKKEKPGAIAAGDFIRTSRTKWKYSIRTNLGERYQAAQDICIDLANKLGLGFGGVDIAWDNNNRKYIIWEVNSAPGLSKPTLEVYANILRNHI